MTSIHKASSISTRPKDEKKFKSASFVYYTKKSNSCSLAATGRSPKDVLGIKSSVKKLASKNI